mmetsp:Transcript_88293/g.254662  ORF Transcript_88293/g.254662 Transcript_88293/m.254662 type:complete len:81 (+) Transcript_88293:1143-1385(+)
MQAPLLVMFTDVPDLSIHFLLCGFTRLGELVDPFWRLAITTPCIVVLAIALLTITFAATGIVAILVPLTLVAILSAFEGL